jgi:hypothetical protein
MFITAHMIMEAIDAGRKAELLLALKDVKIGLPEFELSEARHTLVVKHRVFIPLFYLQKQMVQISVLPGRYSSSSEASGKEPS